MSDTEELVPAVVPDDIVAEIQNAAETRSGPDQFTVPSTPVNDFLQIASGGGAIVEPQAEWAAEGGILNNGFPTGIVLQEQYNKAWRQSTGWIRALGWHASQLIQQNVVDDGNSEKLWRQLYEAYLVQHVIFATSSTNSYTTPNIFGLTWTSPPRAGTEVTLWITNVNTSTTCTLDFAGTGVYPVKHLDGSNPRIGDLAGHVKLSFSSSTWYIDCITMNMLNLRIGNMIFVGTSTTVYISPTGNDSTGTGTVGSPWQTLQYAYNQLSSRYYNPMGFNLTIQMADGVYTGTLQAYSTPTGSPIVNIRGNPGNPAAVRMVTAGNCIAASANTNLNVDGISVQAAFDGGGQGGAGVSADYAAHLRITNVRFETCAFAHMFSTFGGSIACNGPLYIVGGAKAFYFVSARATISAAGVGQNVTVSISGNPNFTTAFAVVDGGGYLYAPRTQLTFSISGVVTGPKHQLTNQASIDTADAALMGSGVDESFFPGNVAGSRSAAEFCVYT